MSSPSNETADRFPPQFQVIPDGDGRFRLAGEIDINVCEELVAQITPALQDGGNGDIVLDLSGLRFIDSCGISAIIQMAKQLDGSRTLFLSSPQSQVARVFDIVGIDRMHPLRIINDGG